jgi:hypothetical protein
MYTADNVTFPFLRDCDDCLWEPVCTLLMFLVSLQEFVITLQIAGENMLLQLIVNAV